MTQLRFIVRVLNSALQETAHLLRSPDNAARLREAREQVEKEIARRARRRRR